MNEKLEKELAEWKEYGPHTDFPWCSIPDAIVITAEHFYSLALDDVKKKLQEAQEKYTKEGERSDAMQDGNGMYWGGVHCAFNSALKLVDELGK